MSCELFLMSNMISYKGEIGGDENITPKITSKDGAFLRLLSD